MDGVGSTRLGRATVRYGSTAVFNGPVRKWKKKWVHVSPSSTVKHSQSNGSNRSASTSILLCRWTSLSSADSGSPADGEDEEQLPKRKFRYTPVAVLEEEQKRAASAKIEAEKDENETKETLDRLNMNEDLKKEAQESNMGNLDLFLCLKGHDDTHVSVVEKEGHEKVASS